MNLNDLLTLWSPLGGEVTEGGATPDPEPAECGNDIMSRGMSWLDDKLQSHLSQPIVYQRGAIKVALCATFGQTLMKLQDDAGNIRMEWTDRDFLFPAASLVISGAATTPRRGDMVRVRKGDTIGVYQVMAPGDEPPWRWSDTYHRRIRVHAKLIDTEDAT